MDNEEKKINPEEKMEKEPLGEKAPGVPEGKEAVGWTIKIGSKLTIKLSKKLAIIICAALAAVAIAGVAIGIAVARNNINKGGETTGNDNGGGQTPCAHVFGDWVVDTEPTCKATGEKHRDCTLCDEQQTEAIPTVDHTPVTDAAVEPTCTSVGLTEGSHCSECDYVFVAQQEIAKSAHEYDDENDEGCNNCDHIRDVNCSHAETKTVVGYGASCTVPGKTDGKMCVLCEEMLVPQQQIKPLGHSFEDYSCSVCHTAQPAGLYDENEQLVASWDELVNTYGLDVQMDYGSYSAKPNYYKNTASSGYNVFNNPDLSAGTKLVIGDEITRIGEYAFYRSSIKDVFISKNIEVIGEGAFYWCEKMESATFADDGALVTIDNFAFVDSSIKEIIIPEGVENFGSQVFGRCDKLEKVYIPSSITEIVYTVFEGCPSLKEITVSEENTRYCSIDGNLYNKDATTIVKYASGKADEVFVIPDSVEYIGYSSF